MENLSWALGCGRHTADVKFGLPVSSLIAEKLPCLFLCPQLLGQAWHWHRRTENV